MAETAKSAARRHRGLAAMLAALSAVGPFSIDAYLPSMPEIGRTLNASPLLVQQTLTAYMAPFALMALWHGAVSDALGRRRVTLAALALFFLASVGCALAWSIESLLFFRTML
ncbi:MAG: MFS transporter [Opitutaceae bacterium]